MFQRRKRFSLAVISSITFALAAILLKGCETTYKTLGVDYIKWNTVSGDGNFQNKIGDSFFVCSAPFFSSDVAAMPPINAMKSAVLSSLSAYGKVYSVSKPLSPAQAITIPIFVKTMFK